MCSEKVCFGLSILMSMFANMCSAQNDFLFTQYFNNRLLLNPAFAGSDKSMQIAVDARFQYVGLSNQISTTQNLGVCSFVEPLKGGLGLSVTNDIIGLQRTTAVNISYAYQKHLKNFSLGVGVNAGFINMSLNGPAIVTPDGEYASGINHRDPILSSARGNSISPDFSAGIYLSNSKFFASISANHLYTSQKLKGTTSDFVYSHDRNFIVSGGYNFSLGRRFYIQPIVLVRTNFQSVQLDVSTILTIYDNIMTGIAFRGYSKSSIDAVSFFLGGKIKNATIMYSYDANVSSLRSFNTGTHELSLQYSIPFKSKRLEGKYYYNSRYL